jgi:hypothetical protein
MARRDFPSLNETDSGTRAAPPVVAGLHIPLGRIFSGSSEVSRGVQLFQENRLANPAECRKMAEQCMRRAQAANASEVKAILISMARTWTALAVQAERLQTLTDRLATNDGSS